MLFRDQLLVTKWNGC